MDGKSARGGRHADGRAVHLLAAFDTRSGIVLGQSVVDGKTNEITAFTPLLDRVDITDAIITADALHTQDEHARYLHQRGAHYVFIVKGNRPKLHQQLAGLPWRTSPPWTLTHDAGHGRRETRTLKLAAVRNAVTGGILFPHAQLAVQIVRRRHPLAAAAGTARPSTPSPTCLAADPRRPARRGHPPALARGESACMDPRCHLRRRSVPDPQRTRPREHGHPAQPRAVAVTASPAPPTSPPHHATSADTPIASCHCSHNSQINYAEALEGVDERLQQVEAGPRPLQITSGGPGSLPGRTELTLRGRGR